MHLKDLLKLINEEIALRPPNQGKVDEYAERMDAGVEFPAIVIGSWPKSDKYGEGGIVDGLHRLNAAKQAKLDDFKTVEKKFSSVQEALTYMYQVNMSHGLAPTESQRNSRIKLVRKIDPTMTVTILGKQFGLSTASIDRIIKGQQGEGKSGPKTGSKRSKSHHDQKPLSPKALLTACERVNATLKHTQSAADLIAYCLPEGKKGPELDINKFAILQHSVVFLQAIVKELK